MFTLRVRARNLSVYPSISSAEPIHAHTCSADAIGVSPAQTPRPCADGSLHNLTQDPSGRLGAHVRAGGDRPMAPATGTTRQPGATFRNVNRARHEVFGIDRTPDTAFSIPEHHRKPNVKKP